jgi:putative SOS response-associated peptidase YedK
VPSWAKDPSAGARLINARAETVAVKPSFRNAFRRRRCLIPADGYYEWRSSGTEGKGAVRKQPYYIHRADGGVLAFAGIYELWRDAALPEDDPGAWLWTAAIVTTRATDDLGEIHDRMPMVVAPDRWADWLDPGLDGVGGLAASMLPAASAGLAVYPVSTAVNSVRNNGPSLVAPLAPGQAPGGEAPVPADPAVPRSPGVTAAPAVTAADAARAARPGFGPAPDSSGRPPGMLF